MKKANRRPTAPTHLHQDQDNAFATVTRREFLATMGVAAGAAALGCSSDSPFAPFAPLASQLPLPSASGLNQIVLVMMENRSFDHFMGWLPGANGRQAGLSFTDKSGISHATYHLQTFTGCGLVDPDHTYGGMRIDYDNGLCDGWLRAANDLFAIGYYGQADLPFLGAAARAWTVCDRYFASFLGPTYPNRIHQLAAQTDRISNTSRICTLPTIFDSLAAAGLTGRYYAGNTAFVDLWGGKYAGIKGTVSSFYADCASGALPQVSFVDAPQSPISDDHPFADIRNGEAFLNQVYTAVTSSPAWPSTLLVITFDEGGGFFDHVPPPIRPIPTADAAAGSDGRLGFRVPTLLISPFARRGFVSSTQFDHTSLLKLIEWRWSLPPLTKRDATAKSLAQALDFSTRNLAVPTFSVPAGPFVSSCTTAP